MVDGDSKNMGQAGDTAVRRTSVNDTTSNTRKRGRQIPATSSTGTGIPAITVSRKKRTTKKAIHDGKKGDEDPLSTQLTRNTGTTETESIGTHSPNEPASLTSSSNKGIIKIDELGFEILDTIFSFFSNGDIKDQSHYENQQSLLGFCNVSRGFYNVARLHLARYIPIASTFKATQILSLCSDVPTFGPLVHRLLLTWPDQGIYTTRRTSVITSSQFISLLSNFPSLRSLELQCLPYYQALDDTLHATLASTNALGNIRNLVLNNSPYSLRKEEFGILRSLACLMPRLESLELLNIPLNLKDAPSEDEEDSLQGLLLPPPSFALKKLSIKITSPRVLDPTILHWLLEMTIKERSCTSLTVWLSTRCTDTFIDHNMTSPSSIKEHEGFNKIECSLSSLSPSLNHLSMLGLRTGQAASILSKTNESLKRLEVYDCFGFGNDGNLLLELPSYSGLEELGIYPNPGMMFGAPPPVVGHFLLLSTPRQQSQHGTGNAAAMTPAAVLRAANAGMRRDPAGLFVPVSLATGPSASSGSTSLTHTSTPHTTNNTSTEESSTTQHQHTFTEIPISSQSFIQELGSGNRLSNLQVVKVPDNARFGKRGRWLNKELIKACRRNGVGIEEIKMT